MPKYGMEKEHKGTQLLHTSGKGVQSLIIYPMADTLYQSKLIGSAFFVILHSYLKKCFNYCSVLENAVSE